MWRQDFCSSMKPRWPEKYMKHSGHSKYCWINLLGKSITSRWQKTRCLLNSKCHWHSRSQERMASVSNSGRTSANGLFPKLNLLLCLSFHAAYFCICQDDSVRNWHWNQRVFSVFCISPCLNCLSKISMYLQKHISF